MDDLFAQMDPIERLKLSLELEGKYASPADMERNAANTSSMLWDMTPVVGNIRSLQDSMQAGREAGDAWEAGDTRGAVLGRIQQALGLAGAVVPGLGPGKGAKDTVNVFVPALGKPLRQATERRLEGDKLADIWHDTGAAVFPDGSVRTELSDAKLMKVNPSIKPGEKRPLGSVISHPHLFDRYPEMRGRQVHLTDEVDHTGKPVYRSTPERYEIGLEADPDEVRSGLAKLMQYDINAEEGWSRGVGHGSGYKASLEDALRQAEAAKGSVRSPEDVMVLRNYMNAIGAKRDDFEAALANRTGKTTANAISRAGVRENAGNHEAYQTARRANAEMDRLPWPHAQRTPLNQQKLPRFDQLTALPQPGIEPDQMLEFARQWGLMGAGRPYGK